MLRFSAGAFVSYSRIYEPEAGLGMGKFQFSGDFSRVAFIARRGFYVYAWNGSHYNPEFSLSLDLLKTYTFLDMAITSDFKFAAVLYTALTISTSATQKLLQVVTFSSQQARYIGQPTLAPPALTTHLFLHPSIPSRLLLLD